jgi:prolyl 4-hydroxylase
VPRSHLESLQCVRYEPGEHYGYHVDTIDEYNELPFGGRLASCLLFLNDGFEGGETSFLDLGLKVTPRTGSALFWFNCHLPFDIDGADEAEVTKRLEMMRPNAATAHAGLAVEAGVKYAANKWVHAVPMARGGQ